MKIKISVLVLLLLCIVSACSQKLSMSSESIVSETHKEIVVETTEKEPIVNKINIEYQDEKTGYDIVRYGKYNATKDDKDDIEWLVVDKNSDSYMLVSKYILDCKNYNEQKIEVSFDNSSLCEWLNTVFVSKTFTNEERKNLNNANEFISNSYKVSLLDLAACKKYFNANIDAEENYLLTAEGTDYAVLNKLEVDEDKRSQFYNCGSYYLVDNGNHLNKAMWVGKNGKIYTSGQSVTLTYGDGVRPVIAINKELLGDLQIKKLSDKVYLKRIESSQEKSEELENINKEELLIESNEESSVVDSNAKSTEIVKESAETEELSIETEEESTEVVKEMEYDNSSKEKYMSTSVPLREKNVVEINDWEYGKTPLAWIYVKPNTQIICNNSPNNSINFSYKKQVSSGSKGCFMPVFTKCDAVGDDYDGRFYSIYDYTKYDPKEMYWSDTDTFESLIYKDHQVKELLEKKYEVERITRNLIEVNDTYVNVVYISELDDIIDKYYR